MMFELPREQFRTMSLYDCKNGLNYRRRRGTGLILACGNQISSNRVVLNRFHEYEHGKSDIFDAHRSEREVTEEMIDAVRSLVEDGPHMICQQIQCSLKISSTVIYSILRDQLRLWKIYASWVSHQPTNDQNRYEFNSGKKFWQDLKSDLSVFFMSLLVINDCFFIIIQKEKNN